MAQSPKRRRRRSLFGLLLLLLLLLLFKLNAFLPGILPGGGRFEQDPQPDPMQPGMLEVLVVREPDREPVQGATIHLAGLDGEKRRGESDGAGKAQFEGLSAQPYRVEAAGSAGIASAWSEPGRNIRMELQSRRFRTGRVLGLGGEPRLRAAAVLLDRNGRVLAINRVDREGRYEFLDSPDAVAVCAWEDGMAPSSAASGDIRLTPGELVRGLIPVERPGEMFEVYALIPDHTEDRLIPLRTRWEAEPDGSYEGRLPAGARAWIVHDGAPYPVGVTAPLRPKAALRGSVNDGAGRPLAGVNVRARPLRHGLLVTPFPDVLNRTTDPDGEFRFESLGEGAYALELSAPGRARMMVQEVTTGSPPTKIVMTPGFRIRGRVLDPDGKPVRDADVFALATPDDRARYPEATTTTTTDGRFVLDRIGGDYARVRVRKEGFVEATMMKVPPNGNVNIRLRKR